MFVEEAGCARCPELPLLPRERIMPEFPLDPMDTEEEPLYELELKELVVLKEALPDLPLRGPELPLLSLC